MRFRIKARVKIEVVIALLLWYYIIHRAFSISITQDEAYTYLLVKTNNWRQSAGTANTHWLNSLFMRLFLWMPGTDNMWKLRMLSILTWPLYSFSAIKLSVNIKNPLVGFVFFLTIIANPFVIFYFSLARGYAAACTFILLALWQAAKLIKLQEIRPRKWILVFLFAAVAALANFSAFYFFIALSATYSIQLLVKKSIRLILNKSALKWHVVVLGTFVFSISSLAFIRYKKELYYGGKNNIVDSLFGSMVKTFSYLGDSLRNYQTEGVSFLLSQQVSITYQVIGWLIFLLLIIAFLFSVYSFYVSKQFSLGSFSILICFFMVLLNATFHLLFNTPYLLERTVLILYPPLIVGLFGINDTIRQHAESGKHIRNTVCCLLIIFLSYNFYRSASLKTFKDWPVQTDTQACLNYLESSHAKNVGMSSWHYDVFINYYLHAYPDKYHFQYKGIPEKITTAGNGKQLYDFDYILICPPYYDSTVFKSWDLKLNFKESGARVYKKRIPGV